MNFDRYPKTRPPLPEELARIYEAHYRENRAGGSLASALSRRVEAWMHRRVARDVVGDPAPRSTLEIGAGSLNQLQYEPETGTYDIVEPFAGLFKDSPFLVRVRHVYEDIREVPSAQVYDRISSIATFEHVLGLPEVMARAGLLLKPTGTLRIAVPSEGTPLWTLSWKLTTGLEFRLRHGLSYGLLMRHEHVNTAREIEDLLRHFFQRVDHAVLGLSRNWSIYQYFECSGALTATCSAYLDSLA